MNRDMTFRASIITPITWSLIILVFGWPLSALVCLPANLIWDDAVFMPLTFFVLGVWLILVWIYFMTLRVTLEPSLLAKTSLLRSKSVLLDERTLIRHRAEHVVLEGVNLSAAFTEALGQEATTHIQITIRDSSRQIKVGSALKGISKLRDQLIAFEAGTILPATQKRLQSGDKVILEPFEFQNTRATYSGTSAEIPLPQALEVKAGILHFQIAGKRKKIALKKIWNPVTCLRLLSEGIV